VIDSSLALTKANQSSNNDITDALELTFATDDERFGETVSIELKPGGDDIEVTNENKHEYVEYVNPCRSIPEAC
jgi:E3 ubiquitin-protein ligase NEDD4